MLPSLSQNFHHQVGESVHHRRLIEKFRTAGYEPERFYQILDAIQIAQVITDGGQKVDPAQPCSLIPLFDGEIRTELSGVNGSVLRRRLSV